MIISSGVNHKIPRSPDFWKCTGEHLRLVYAVKTSGNLNEQRRMHKWRRHVHGRQKGNKGVIFSEQAQTKTETALYVSSFTSLLILTSSLISSIFAISESIAFFLDSVAASVKTFSVAERNVAESGSHWYFYITKHNQTGIFKSAICINPKCRRWEVYQLIWYAFMWKPGFCVCSVCLLVEGGHFG